MRCRSSFAGVSHRRTMENSCRRKRAFTLVELLVVIGIIAVLLGILIPVMRGVREQASRLKCSSNLRQLGTAMFLYATTERDGGYPRTVYNANQHLQLDNAGFDVADSFGKKGYVGENNVPASLFLLVKTQHLPTSLFLCPATDGEPGFKNKDPQLSSNWEFIPQNLTYSMAAPFPTSTARKAGFVWGNLMRSDFAILGDMNPGTRGGASPPNNAQGPPHDAAPAALAAANSNNHRNKGQNVLYGDGHVEFQSTPYCGAMRDSAGFRDNIYTAGTGDGGLTSDKSQPVDEFDSVLLPTDDPGGK